MSRRPAPRPSRRYAAFALWLVACSHAPPSDRDARSDVAAPRDDTAAPSVDARRADAALADAADASPADVPAADAPLADVPAADGPAAVYGVTVDDVSNLAGVVASLRALPRRPTARIVFDEGQPPSAYVAAARSIHDVAGVMGEILDSAYVAGVTVDAYTSRTNAYLAELGDAVDVWEVGNEINGNWVDTSSGGTADVVAKMSGAFDIVHAAGRRTALTLYGCSDADRAHDMVTWATANVPARMRTGLDYVLVSFYEGDCGVAAPAWPSVFHQLRALFPTAALGFGETGAVNTRGDRITDATVAGPYLTRYYTMSITEPGYIGGYFWWYFAEDMVPASQPMFTALADAIR